MRERFRSALFWICGILSMVAVYCLVYLCFKGNSGFPPGADLEKSDWLSFCGSFLSFSSSTLMAVVVFRQDRKINSLLRIEYDPILAFRVHEFDWIDSDCAKKSFSRYHSMILDGHPLLCEQFIFAPAQSSCESDADCCTFQFSFSLSNHGKLPVQSVVVNRIMFGNNICLYEKDVDSKLMELGKIQPNGTRYLCIRLDSFPRPRKSALYKLRVDYTVNVTDDLVRSGDFELLINGDESTVFDGMDYLRR